MADISSLTSLKTTEPLDLPLYKTARQAKPFPPADTYTARTPESFPAESFGESAAGFLTVDVSPTIVGGEFDGYRIAFTKVSAKTWTNRDGQAESQLGRYLKACGINETISGEPQDQASACDLTANQLVEIEVDWVARQKGTMWKLKGMKNFPLNPDGTHSRFVPMDGENGRPLVKDPITGDTVDARAFLEVVRFRPVA